LNARIIFSSFPCSLRKWYCWWCWYTSQQYYSSTGLCIL